MKTKILGWSLLLALVLTGTVLAWAAPGYLLDWYVLTGAGGGQVSSSHYKVDFTVGQTVIGTASSTHYGLGLVLVWRRGGSPRSDTVALSVLARYDEGLLFVAVGRDVKTSEVARTSEVLAPLDGRSEPQLPANRRAITRGRRPPLATCSTMDCYGACGTFWVRGSGSRPGSRAVVACAVARSCSGRQQLP